MNWGQLLTVPSIIFVIPIVAILGGVVTNIVMKYFRHRERMAMIAEGLHPDYPPEADSDELLTDSHTKLRQIG